MSDAGCKAVEDFRAALQRAHAAGFVTADEALSAIARLEQEIESEGQPAVDRYWQQRAASKGGA